MRSGSYGTSLHNQGTMPRAMGRKHRAKSASKAQRGFAYALLKRLEGLAPEAAEAYRPTVKVIWDETSGSDRLRIIIDELEAEIGSAG